jgi:tetratricopeptide (TPR) repeat protein
MSTSLSREFSFSNCGKALPAATATSPPVLTPARRMPPALLACVVANASPPKETGPLPRDELNTLDNRVQKNQRDAVAFYRRGQIYAWYNYFSHAINDFGRAIRLNANDPEAFNNRCWARIMLGDKTAALQDCNGALRIRREYGDALDSRGLIFLQLCSCFAGIRRPCRTIRFTLLRKPLWHRHFSTALPVHHPQRHPTN